MTQGTDFEVRRQLVQMQMLYEIGLAINQSLDPTYVAQEVLHRALAMVDARSGMLLVREQDLGALEVIAQVGLDEPAQGRSEILALTQLREAWGERLLIQMERKTSWWRHLCILPLESQHQVNGLLVMADKEYRDGSVGPFGESDESLLRSFAYQAGIALHNARLHQHLEQAYERLRQGQKMEVLGQLAGGVAHDFNNLLTLINGFSELAMRRLDERSPVRDTLAEIRQAGQRAIALTRQLLAFSRDQDHQPEAVDSNRLITEMCKMLGRLISERIELHFYPAPSLGSVLADPGQIEQALMNLAVNARDAMPEGGVLSIETREVELDRAHARAHVDAQTGPHVRISVADTGTGMDAQTQARIFEPFFTTKPRGEGTGLGLAMVQSIVRQSGGHITLESQVGTGTTFHVYLPRTDPPPGGAE